MPTQDEINGLQYADPANWHHTLYASKKDSRIVVPKRTGLHGVTVNFAKPLGILIHVFNIAVLTGAVVYVYCTFICKA
jgi:uncharacterized membrane protein